MSHSPVNRARNADLLVFAVNGFMIATWMSRLPDVKSMMGLTPGQLGIILLSISVGALIGLPIAGRLLHRMGSVSVVRLGAAIALPGMITAALGVTEDWPLPTVMLGLALVGFGSGIWDVAQNLEGTIIEQALGRSIMPWFHAAFSGGTVAGALATVLMIRLQIPLLGHVLVMAVLVGACVAWGTRQFMPATAPDDSGPAHEQPAAQHRSAWTEPRTLLIGVMVFAAAFTEGTANDWMAVAFVDGHGVTTSQGVLALAVFLVFMTAGRIAGTKVLDRHGRVPVLRVLFGCALVGSLVVVFGGTALAYLGAAIWGLGASLGFPVGMSAAADEPRRAALRLSVVATIGYGAFLAGPAVIGFVGDYVGVLRALTIVSVVSALAFLVIPAARPLPDAKAPANRDIEGARPSEAPTRQYPGRTAPPQNGSPSFPGPSAVATSCGIRPMPKSAARSTSAASRQFTSARMRPRSCSSARYREIASGGLGPSVEIGGVIVWRRAISSGSLRMASSSGMTFSRRVANRWSTVVRLSMTVPCPAFSGREATSAISALSCSRAAAKKSATLSGKWR